MGSDNKEEKQMIKKEIEDVEGLDDGLAVDYDLSDNEEGVEINDNDDDDNNNKENKQDNKKRKNNEAQKSKKKQKMEFEKESKESLSSERNDIIIEKLSSKIRELYPELSALELSEYYLNKKNIMDSSEFKFEHELNNFEKFINTFLKNLIPSIKEYKKLRNKIKKYETKKKFNKKFDKKIEIPKRKFILILSISAIRACDVHRATRNIEGGSIKLIQKNPIGQDLKMLRTTWSRILNATPGRVDKILEISKKDHERNPNNEISLKEDEIEAVILDNYVDLKLRSVLEDKETFELLKKLKIANPNIKVYLY